MNFHPPWAGRTGKWRNSIWSPAESSLLELISKDLGINQPVVQKRWLHTRPYLTVEILPFLVGQKSCAWQPGLAPGVFLKWDP